MTDLELGWVAGLFEGEGSIVLTKVKNRKDSYRVMCVVSSTDKDVIESFTKIVNFGKMNGPYKPSDSGRKLRYTWDVQNQKECLKFLKLILPQLHSRRSVKALEVINFLEERLAKHNV